MAMSEVAAETRDILQRAVVALAQPADVQLSLFPDFVCKADELALDFEDGLYELVGHKDEITGEQQANLDALDRLLSGMNDSQDASVWTEEALRTHPAWVEVRTAAAATAAAFGWELTRPMQSRAIYIPSSK